MAIPPHEHSLHGLRPATNYRLLLGRSNAGLIRDVTNVISDVVALGELRMTVIEAHRMTT